MSDFVKEHKIAPNCNYRQIVDDRCDSLMQMTKKF